MRSTITVCFLALVVGMLVAGCGQKGDLYLPDDQPTSKSSR
ncbi:MAG: lipoprotein [Chromatiales bacterium]|nr:lipoprotein [Chromatiales bacterium]